MNWIAWDARPFAGATLGGAGGAWAMSWGAPEHIWPGLVSLGMGLGAAALARDQSRLRGWILGALSLWASAIAQVAWFPPRPGEGLLAGLAAFHETLTPALLVQHAAGCLAAGWLSARSLRRGTQRRVAGA